MARKTVSPWSLVLRFCALFLFLIALYAALFNTPLFERFVHAPMSRLVALCSLPLLSLVGDASLRTTFLEFNGFRGVIVEACNGVLPIYIYLAAVAALPSGWPQKLWGALIGVPVIFIVNVIRVISLMILGATRPDIVERIHIHVWQTLIVALAMGIWIYWAERFVRPELALRR